MDDELAGRIRAEIKAIEGEMKERKAALKTCAQTEQWDIEVAMRALRVRLEELEHNLQSCA
ncbi:MAG: hypothetical protein Q7T81_02165 [Pseudolabrys sp.]|nr:hypothetical protein [Pseudolabrys sp.]